MSSNTENQSSSMDGLKWGVVTLLLAAAVVGNYIFDDLSVLIRAVAVVAVVIVAGLVALQTEKGAAALNFAKESRLEARKVVWPTRQEAIQTTAIVMLVTVLTALLLWGLDGILVRVVNWLLNL